VTVRSLGMLWRRRKELRASKTRSSFAFVYLWSVGSACDLTIVIIVNIYLISNPKDVVSLKVV